MIQTHKLSKMVFANTDKLNTVCSKLTQFFEGYKMTHCIILKDKYRHRLVTYAEQNVYEIILRKMTLCLQTYHNVITTERRSLNTM